MVSLCEYKDRGGIIIIIPSVEHDSSFNFYCLVVIQMLFIKLILPSV